MKFSLFATFITIYKVTSLRFCNNCKFYKVVRISNDYKIITELCTAYIKPDTDDYDFFHKLCHSENLIFEKDSLNYYSCIDSRKSEIMCGNLGLDFSQRKINDSGIYHSTDGVEYIENFENFKRVQDVLDFLKALNNLLDNLEKKIDDIEESD